MNTRIPATTAALNSCRFMLLLALLILAAGGQAVAQTGLGETILPLFDAYRSKALQEKVYLHLDRPFYACGETMWFKVYTTDGTLHKPLDMSKVAYVEVLDEALQPVLQGKIALKNGTGNGSLMLPLTLKSGNYRVRAYTNWMKNFDPEFYFDAPITIVNSFNKLGPVPAQAVAAHSVQFFPEGGNLVQNIPAKVAFQAVDNRTGKGISFTGKVVDEAGNEVAQLRTHKFGMGSFTFTPAAATTYTAIIELPGRQVMRQKLPQVQDQGYSLHLEELSPKQLKITVSAVGLGPQPEQVYLLGHARQMISVAEGMWLMQGNATFVVDKEKLGEGITHLTVFNGKKKPVAERLYFKRPAQQLAIEVQNDKRLYGTREKVSTSLQTQAQAGQPVAADLSVAVYKLDSLQAATQTGIHTFLWLTSDLKGTIEQPEYYLTTTGPEAEEATENLMLTHGWSRFNWENVLQEQNATYKYLPEYGGHVIRGKVTDAATGANARGITTYLASPSKHIRLYPAISDVNGWVQFETKDLYGTKELIMQSNLQRDSTYHFEIFSPFAEKHASTSKLGALNLTERLRQELTQRHVGLQVPYTYYPDKLNAFYAPGIDSTAFYGKANQTYLLDDYIRFKVMEEVMREYVPGVQVRLRQGKFHFMVFDTPHSSIFNSNPLVLLDGVPIFDIDKIMAFDPLKVRKLEVFTSQYFLGPHSYPGLVSYTTYQGDLGGFKLNPRALLVEYEGLQLQRQFYAPTYDNEQQKLSRLPDFRNLLHWQPTVVTGADGKAALSFYTSDQAGKYVMVVQGLATSGLAGSQVVTFEVGQSL